MKARIAVLNFSGNVGKTTVAAHLLKPRMETANIISVESINSDASADGIEVEKMRGKKFGELQEQMMQTDSAIVDVGSSNVEEFLRLMKQYAGSHEDFDYFIVPVVKERKQLGDTVNTIRALATLGIEASKIRVLFNKLDGDDQVEEEFAALIGLHQSEGNFTLRPNARIYTNEVFGMLKGTGKTITELALDTTDYKTRLGTSDEEQRASAARAVSRRRLAVTAKHNLDEAFQALFS